jgi:A/G-specific adenine glycosylase
LVAELLLRRTTAAAVAKMYDGFINHYPDLKKLSEANESSLQSELKGIGYNVFRSKFIKSIASTMISSYGRIPGSLEELMSIRHIGLYTAGAIVSQGYNIPAPMVDSNVLRLLERLLGEKMNPIQAFHFMKKSLPKDHSRFNLGLIDLAMRVCQIRAPKCHDCPIRISCAYAHEVQSHQPR